MNHILIVDDDERLRTLINRYLSKNNFLVNEAKSSQVAWSLVRYIKFDLIILDRMMPSEDGLAFMNKFKEKNYNSPVLMLTAMGEIEQRIEGLSSGVDDYLVKPFEPKELLLRIKNIIHRTTHLLNENESYSERNENIIYLGDNVFNLKNKQLACNGINIHLTNTETELLHLLATNIGEVFSREYLSSTLGIIGADRAIDVQITRLRKKVEPNLKQPRYLQTIRGQGYALKI